MARQQGEVCSTARGRSPHQAALDGAARDVRRRVLPHAERDDLRPAGPPGSDLRWGGRPAGGEVRGASRRRSHLHFRGGDGAGFRPTPALVPGGGWRIPPRRTGEGGGGGEGRSSGGPGPLKKKKKIIA